LKSHASFLSKVSVCTDLNPGFGGPLTIAMLEEIRFENKQLKKQLNELNQKKSQESESREDSDKNEFTKELLIELKSSRAEIQELRNEMAQLKSRGNQEMTAPKAANSKKPKSSKAKKSANSNPNPIPGLHVETKAGASSSGDDKDKKSYQEMEGMDAFNDGDENEVKKKLEGYQYQGPKGRKKNKGKKKEPEIKLSKKEQLAAREVIIHGIPTPAEKDKYNKEKEAILIMGAFDELKTKYLGSAGVDIDIERDICYHDRIVEHHDAERIGCQPVKVRFRKQTFCDSVKKAANSAGALNGRRIIKWGKYITQRKK
jgi:hypothetical protein